jgi:hypothetical protein
MSLEFTLQGKQEGDGNGDRVTAVATLANHVAASKQHVDGVRQRNVTIALAIFAALFTFGLRSSAVTNAFLSSCALTVLMLMFAATDRKYHLLSHGYRET